MNLWEGGLKLPVGTYGEAMKSIGCKKAEIPPFNLIWDY
jgi:hypothetical protein